MHTNWCNVTVAVGSGVYWGYYCSSCVLVLRCWQTQLILSHYHHQVITNTFALAPSSCDGRLFQEQWLDLTCISHIHILCRSQYALNKVWGESELYPLVLQRHTKDRILGERVWRQWKAPRRRIWKQAPPHLRLWPVLAFKSLLVVAWEPDRSVSMANS